ncbi:MAG: hypothetical protein HQK84_05270 [Nitrospinae bacterium]|nr:hypothetical protein [Nitrospinota bacterium]
MKSNTSINKELWKNDCYLSEVENHLDTIKLLSVDIFDTLILRSVHSPQDIFTHCGEEAIQQGFVKTGIHPTEFKKARIHYGNIAHGEALRQSREETLKEIYSFIPLITVDAQKLVDLEVLQEKKYCYVNPVMLSLINFFNERNVPVVLLSDMYLSTQQMTKILEGSGLSSEKYRFLFISNESRGPKGNGELFRQMMEKFPDISSNEMIHIGDSIPSDINGAKLAEIPVIHYTNPEEMDFIFGWENVRHGRILPELSSFRLCAARLSGNLPDKNNFWHIFGSSILGPFFSAYAEWVVDICVRENKKKVFPIMRGGIILKRFIECAASNRNISLAVEPLYVSRLTTAFSTINEFDRDEVEYLFVRRNVTVEGLFTLLELPEEAISPYSTYKEVIIQDSDDIIFEESKTLRESLINYISQEKYREQLNNRVKEERTLLMGYLNETCGNLNDAVTVDFGFQGTIQSNIDKALSIEGKEERFLHLIAFGEEMIDKHVHAGSDIRGFVGNSGENLDLIRSINRSPAAIETLLMENMGSVIGYQNEGTKVIPVLSDIKAPVEEFKNKTILIEAALRFQELWFQFKKIKPETACQLLNNKRELCKLIHRVIDLPTPNEVKNLGSLHHEDNYGSKILARIIDAKKETLPGEASPNIFMRKGRYGFDHCPISWYQGTVSVQHPTYLLNRFTEVNNCKDNFALMSDLCEIIKDNNINEVTLYGIGTIGRAFIDVARLNKISINFIVDGNNTLWGSSVEGIEVISLEEAIARGCTTYAISSLGYAIEIIKTIKKRFTKEPVEPKIFAAPWYF